MVEQRTTAVESKACPRSIPSTSEDDSAIMSKIRLIVGRGNNAEVKRKKDGTLAVMEVKKNIV